MPSDIFHCIRILSVLGHPTSHTWPELDSLYHWHDNTDNVRARQPHHPSGSRLDQVLREAMVSNLPSWMGGKVPAECSLPPEAIQLLGQMLDFNPNTRITAEQAMQHPFFTSTEPRPSLNAFVLTPVMSSSHGSWGVLYLGGCCRCRESSETHPLICSQGGEPTIRYPKRAVGPSLTDAQQQQPAQQQLQLQQQLSAIPPPQRAQRDSQVPPGTRPSAAGAAAPAAAQGRKRKPDGAPPPGFR